MQTTKSASLPTLIDPIRSSSFKILAGLIVMALIASYSGSPALCARAALKDKYCSGTTGESVIMQNGILAL